MKKLLLIILSINLISCATSPTGRHQFMMVNDSSIAPQAAQSFEEMKKKEKVVTKPAITDFVQCVAQPLINEARLEHETLPANWEIVVFDSETVNAFAMPGGKIGVYTGLIDLAENPDQLAAVLGHEIGHVMAQHAAERMSTAQLTVLAMTVAGVASSRNQDQAIIMAALGIGAQIGIQLPFSRVHESEADQIGQELMAKSGFDPAQAIRLWEVMEKGGGARPPEWLSTHPNPEDRAQRLSDFLPETEDMYKTALNSGKHPHCVMPVKPATTVHKDNEKKKNEH